MKTYLINIDHLQLQQIISALKLLKQDEELNLTIQCFESIPLIEESNPNIIHSICD